MTIDYSYIQTEIGRIAKRDFEGRAISTSLIKLYCEEIRSFVKGYISERIEATYREYLSIIPSTRKGDFLNLEHGYLISMTNWANSNTIVFPEIDFLEESYEERHAREEQMSLSDIANKESVRILGIGSVVNIILWISGLKILSIVAEAAVIGIGAYKLANESSQPSSGRSSQNAVFETKANSYIEEVNEQIKQYAQNAEFESKRLLQTYL